MLILALAGLFALGFGRITVTSSLSLSGRSARLYGLALLVAALIYGVTVDIAGVMLAKLLPGIGGNEILGMVARFAVVAGIVVGLVPVFRPKPAGTITAVYKT